MSDSAPEPAPLREAIARWIALAATPFVEGGLGDELQKRGDAYLADYVLSTDGADYEPNEFERALLADAFAGLLMDEALFGPIRAILAALPTDAVQPVGGWIMGGPYRAQYGAIHHEAERGFLFTVSDPTAAVEVAKGLNALHAMNATAPTAGSGWLPIESAPKDGTWVQAWRKPPSFTGPRWEPLIYVRWDDEEGSWVWPCDSYEVFTIRGRELADMQITDGDYYAASDFTHWMPLPAAPTVGGE